MRISKEWATPLTIGSFAIMATTGVLMFFKLDTGLNKEAHEWLGWLMIAAVASHVIFHWTGFKRYFATSLKARAIIGCCLAILAGSFFLSEDEEDGAPPPVLAMRAVLNTPLADVAPLTGRPVEAIIADLQAAGFTVQADQSLAAVTKGERSRESKAMSVLFAVSAQLQD